MSSQRLCPYRPRGAGAEDERVVRFWYRPEEAPASIDVDGAPWDLVPYVPRDEKQAVKCIREGIRSIQLPRWWPYAKRHAENGDCIFENETEAIEACKRAQAAGEPVSWQR